MLSRWVPIFSMLKSKLFDHCWLLQAMSSHSNHHCLVGGTLLPVPTNVRVISTNHPKYAWNTIHIYLKPPNKWCSTSINHNIKIFHYIPCSPNISPPYPHLHSRSTTQGHHGCRVRCSVLWTHHLWQRSSEVVQVGWGRRLSDIL